MGYNQDFIVVYTTKQGSIKKDVTGDILSLYHVYIDMIKQVKFIDKITIYRKVTTDIAIKEYEIERV